MKIVSTDCKFTVTPNIHRPSVLSHLSSEVNLCHILITICSLRSHDKAVITVITSFTITKLNLPLNKLITKVKLVRILKRIIYKNAFITRHSFQQ